MTAMTATEILSKNDFLRMAVLNFSTLKLFVFFQMNLANSCDVANLNYLTFSIFSEIFSIFRTFFALGFGLPAGGARERNNQLVSNRELFV